MDREYGLFLRQLPTENIRKYPAGGGDVLNVSAGRDVHFVLVYFALCATATPFTKFRALDFSSGRRSLVLTYPRYWVRFWFKR